MSFQAKAILDRREILADGSVRVRLAREVRNGDVVVSRQWHRFTIAPGGNATAMLAGVNANLGALGFPSVSAADEKAIIDAVALAGTASAQTASAGPA